MFITLYGINNIGKTYHAERLVETLRADGKKAEYLKYPVYDEQPTGEMLNTILRSRRKQEISEIELQLIFVLNRYQYQEKLIAKLKKGIWVVAEDYIGTGIAWGIAKGSNKHELELMNKFLVRPDLEILMDGQRHLSAKEKRHIHEQNDALVERCRRVHQKLAKEYGWKIVKVAPDKDVTASRLWDIIAPFHVS